MEPKEQNMQTNKIETENNRHREQTDGCEMRGGGRKGWKD